MKFSKPRQLFLVSSIGLLVAAFLTACSITTIDYVFVASSSGIETYAVDSESGALRPGAATITAGLNSPIAMALSPDYGDLYVANQGNNTIVHYAIASNGVLTEKDSVTAAGTPTALAVNSAGTYLYATIGTSSATFAVYPLSSGTIGTSPVLTPLVVPGYAGDTIVPTGVTVLANNGGDIVGNAVYVSAYDQSAYNPGGTTTSTANPGWVFGFTIGANSALTPAANSPYQAGVKPSAILSDPTDRFVYVTDFASNELIGYTIQDGSTLNFLVNGPFKTGNEPSAIAIDPRGKFLYVTNEIDSTVTAYAITLANGNPSAVFTASGIQSNSTDTQPVAVAVDPALGRFVYTANYLGDSLSGFRLDPTAGSLIQTQATPYPTGQKPTALVIIPHGNHATQTVTP